MECILEWCKEIENEDWGVYCIWDRILLFMFMWLSIGVVLIVKIW